MVALGVAMIGRLEARQGTPLNFWGLPASLVAGLAALGVLLAFSSERRILRRAGAAVLCIVLGLAAWAIFWWLYAFRAPPWSLWFWLWLIGFGLATGSLLALRRAVRT